MSIRVYRIPFSTNVERVALAAGHKGVEIEWFDVDEDDRSPVEAVSGQRLVPVLETDGFVLADSPKILEWLEQHHPEPPLLPAEPSRRGEVRGLRVSRSERLEPPPPFDQLEDRGVVVDAVRDVTAACERRDQQAGNPEASLPVRRGGRRYVVEEASPLVEGDHEQRAL